jgi:lipoyl(octanoyl) transferase
MLPICNVHWLGNVPYELAWRLQDELAVEIAAGSRPPTLLLLEHPHTYTFGRSGRAENLLWEEAERARREVEVHWVDRGGDVTYHGPGQLVGYPLLSLGSARLPADQAAGSPRLPQADYIGYVRNLERMLIAALAELGVSGFQVPGLTGVWVQPEGKPSSQKPAKIAAIGVKVDVRGISRHGFALNINPDMVYWEGIIGCGLKEHPVVSLADLLEPAPPMEAVRAAVVAAFGMTFKFDLKEISGALDILASGRT